jgi:hypothetical protein
VPMPTAPAVRARRAMGMMSCTVRAPQHGD